MEIGKIKAEVSKLAKTKGIDVQSAWDIFFFDEILLRLTKSKYNKSFVIKGGFYLQSIVGVETRSTMDIDFKFIGNELSNEELKNIFTDICSNNESDNINFEIISIDDITAETKYGGKTVKIEGKFFNVKKRFGIDIGIGDVITPYPIEYDYKPSFKNEECKLLAYTIETMIAEKFETLISKGTQNSRSKDLFDLYLLNNEKINVDNLNNAMINTFNLRGTDYSKDNILKSLDDIFNFYRIKVLYENYARKNNFVKNVTFKMCKDTIYRMLKDLHFNDKILLFDYKIELDLIRHGESELEKVGGWSNSHLTEKGKNEIKNLLPELDKYDLFISSDLNRAKETSDIINETLGMNVIFDKNFREMNNGKFKDMNKNDFLNLSKDYRYSSLKMDEKYPDGESPNEFYLRIRKAFMEMIEHYNGKKILLVTHAEVIVIILCLIKGYEYSNKLKIAPNTGTIIKLR